MIRFEKAKPEDAKALARVSGRAFDNDIHYGAPGPGGPPGYNSDRWQRRMMVIGNYYKKLDDDRIIGGFIVFPQGGGYFVLGRICIDPDRQNQGIGAQAIAFMEQSFTDARCWTLGTPRWNRRNHHFYEKVGYARIGEDGPDGYLYEKRMPAPSTGA